MFEETHIILRANPDDGRFEFYCGNCSGAQLAPIGLSIDAYNILARKFIGEHRECVEGSYLGPGVLRRIRLALDAIAQIVNTALDKARVTDGPWRQEQEGVLAEVRCDTVEFVVGTFQSGSFVATIEGAAHECPALVEFVKGEIAAVGLADIQVITEYDH